MLNLSLRIQAKDIHFDCSEGEQSFPEIQRQPKDPSLGALQALRGEHLLPVVTAALGVGQEQEAPR